MSDIAPPAWTEVWDMDVNRFYYRRSDGATVTPVATRTGKRPWRGSRWHEGRWKTVHPSHYVAAAETAMANIDRHWPSAMKETDQ